MEDDENGSPPERPESLLPYDAWTEEALRHVVIARSPCRRPWPAGEHHFYVSFQDGPAGRDHPAAAFGAVPA